MSDDGMDYASHQPGRPPAEFAAIQAQRIAAQLARGDEAGAAATRERTATPGTWSPIARDERTRDANRYRESDAP